MEGRETLALVGDRVVCDHKDCERVASRVEFMRYSRHGEFLGQRTFYFCREHREALYALERTPSLPPREWLEDNPGGLT